jgi:hypothetical protein
LPSRQPVRGAPVGAARDQCRLGRAALVIPVFSLSQVIARHHCAALIFAFASCPNFYTSLSNT